MMSINSKLRENARVQLEGKWGKPILFGFLYIIIAAMPSLLLLIGKNHPDISLVLQIIASVLITGSLMVGAIMFSLRFKRGEEPGSAVVFEGFKHFGPTLGLYLWYLLWVLLWSLLLLIPGIMKSISYSMCFYVLADNPKIGIKNALNISKKITKGYKGKIFVLYLSFTGWVILAIVSLGIGFLWLIPYWQISYANLYDELKNESIEKFVCTFEEYTKTS